MTWLDFLFALFAPRPVAPAVPPPPRPAPVPEPKPPASADLVDLLTLLNAARAHYSRGSLTADAKLAAISASNDRQQAAHGLGHYDTGGLWQVAVEGADTAAAAVDAWLASKPHRAIILDPTLARVGWDHQAPYWTATFSR